MAKKLPSIVNLGIFTKQHMNPPSPFNPNFIPWAKDVSTLATYQCYLDGVYDLPIVERVSLRRAKYNELMLLGKPLQSDVIRAKDYIYNL